MDSVTAVPSLELEGFTLFKRRQRGAPVSEKGLEGFFRCCFVLNGFQVRYLIPVDGKTGCRAVGSALFVINKQSSCF